jgi:lipopolysaccharide transport system permease protein
MSFQDFPFAYAASLARNSASEFSRGKPAGHA